MDPSSFTLRELDEMIQGHQRDVWTHTTHILCTLANVNRDPKRPPIQFNEVYPFADTVAEPQQPAEAIDASQGDDVLVAKAFWLAMCAKQ